MKTKIVGSRYHATGPLMLAGASAKTLVRARDAKTLEGLRRDKKTVGIRTIGGSLALIFPGQLPSTYRPLGDRAGVLVRLARSTKKQGAPGHWHSVPRALDLDPWLVPETSYDLAIDSFEHDGSVRFLFDAVSRMATPDKTTQAEIEVQLPVGTYAIDRATYGEKEFRVDLFRIRPENEIPTHKGRPPDPKAAPGLPPALVLRPETRKLAKRAPFVSGDGGPLLVIPTALLSSWHGLETKDYDRACKTKGHVMKVGNGQALVIPFPNCIAFLSLPNHAALLLLLIAGDDETHCVEAALSAPDSAWKKSKETFTMTGKELALFDSGDDGKANPMFVGTLAPGRYSIERMTEFDGEIVVGKVKHRLMASALRLRLLRGAKR